MKIAALFLPLLLSLSVLPSRSFAQVAQDTDDDYTSSSYDDCADQPRAVIVGASVSMGFFGPSPALLYLERAGFSRACIMKKTFPIADSEKNMPWLKEQVRSFKPDLIFAFDFMFHDINFTHGEDQIPDHQKMMADALDYLKSTKIPTVIGTVFAGHPDTFPFQVKMAKQANQHICAAQNGPGSNIFVLPTARIYRELYSDNFLVTVDGEKQNLAKEDVLVDMYHVGPRGAYLLTNRLIAILNDYHKTSRFPYDVPFFDTHKMIKKSIHRQLTKKLLRLKKSEIFGLDKVNADTIPADNGDEACSPGDGFVGP